MSIIDELEEQITELREKINLIQEQCNHPAGALSEKRGSSFGNYDPSCDCSWIDYNCSLCKKRWTVND
jgi:hypothetical protein